MLRYTFSTREKALILALAVVLVGMAWYLVVYEPVNSSITQIETQISDSQTQMLIDQQRAQSMAQWQAVIEERKAAGVSPTEVPDYDNLANVMGELNGILSDASTYTISFEEVDTESSEYAERGVTITYTTTGYDAACEVVEALETGTYPCSVDSFAISTSGTSRSSAVSTSGTATDSTTYSARVHAVFYERQATSTTSTTSSSDSAT